MTPTKPPPSQLQLHTKADVAALLNIPLSQLTYLLHVVPPERRYRSFELQRKSGNPRTIRAPIKPLKSVQGALAVALGPYYRVPHTVHGYVNGRSILTNARIHRSQRWVLRIDLKDFFPSINFGRVRGLLLAAPFLFPPAVATLLAQICCHANELPQGAPTSPLISNLICRPLDRRLARLASEARCYYSRYCDDLVFSTNRRSLSPALIAVDPETGAVRASNALREAIEASGFRINDEKTRLRKRTQRQLVTGLVTNVFVNIPRDYVGSVRTLLYIWSRYGEADARTHLLLHRLRNRPPGKAGTSLALIARGNVQYIGSVKGWNSSVYKSLAARLAVLDPTFRRTTRASGGPPTLLRVLAEGKTDYIHLESAIQHLQAGGEFADLDLRFLPDSGDKGGDDELLKHCGVLARLKQQPPVVCIFDRDNPRILSQVATEAPFKAWGNDVFSVVTPHPAHRDSGEPLCIELLYDDDLLRLPDSQGRRLYFKHEFNQESGQHSSERVYCTNPHKESLIRDDDVFRMDTGAKVSLSKRAFADAIAARRGPYAKAAVDGFRPLFEVLRQIARHLRATT
jgi:RNA-directed DNA polymerase